MYWSILAMSVLLYAFFWVIPRRLNFICQRFGTLCLFHLHRRVGIKNDGGWQCWGIYKEKCLARKFSSQNFSCTISYRSFILLTSTRLWRWNRQSVPKRRHIKTRRRVITQKKAYNNLLMLCKVIVIICSEICRKHINSMWEPSRIFEC